MTTINENMIEVDTNTIYDIESGVEEIEHKQDINIQTNTDTIIPKSILIKNNEVDNVKIDCCVKISCILLNLVITLPLVITELYYAYTDESCVHQKAGKLHINLFTYLAVNGILGCAGTILVSLNICFIDHHIYITCFKTGCLNLILIVSSIFNILWTVIGSVIFWNLINNKECSEGIYNFIFITLIVRYLLIFICLINLKKK
jgi:hypothetical protein